MYVTKAMDMFKMDQPLQIGPLDQSKMSAEMSFDTGTDFGLNFFTSDSPPPGPPPPYIKKEEYDEPHSSCIYERMSSEGIYGQEDQTDGLNNNVKQEYRTFVDVSFATAQSLFEQSQPSVASIKKERSDSPVSLTVPVSPPPVTQKHPALLKAGEQVQSSSDSSTTSKNFVPCRVCGDKASGYHYGVTSCEGCKGFFRRSIQKQIEYRCLREGKCLVMRLNRNRCQFCRFKKCLAVGMSRDSVRYGRVPKRARERAEQENSDSFGSGGPDDDRDFSRDFVLPEREDMKNSLVFDLIRTVGQAHHVHCSYTEDRTKHLHRKPIEVIPLTGPTSPGVPTSTMESNENHRLALFTALSSHIHPAITQVVEFAKRVPGFLELSREDQLILIKLGFIELWMCYSARMVSTADGTLTFPDGSIITQRQLENIFDGEFVSSFFDFASTFASHNLSDSEVALYAAAVLLNSERTGLTDVKAIVNSQEKVLDALKFQLSRTHMSDQGIPALLIQRKAELDKLNQRHNVLLDWFRNRWSRLQIPPLYAEMFDIARSEEDLNSC